MPAKKIHKLDWGDDFDFYIYAIVSSVKDFRLCFEMNERLRISMRRMPDLEISDRQRNRSVYSHFYYARNSGEEFRLVCNRGSQGHFVPEKKSVDFFLALYHMSEQEVQLIAELIRNMEAASGIYAFEPSELKSADHFLYFG